MAGLKLVYALLWLLYPLAIYFGLRVMEPRYVAILLGLALLLRRRQQAGQLLAGLTWAELSIMASLIVFAALTALTNSEMLLRFYPVAMSAGMLLLFGMSLAYPPSMVERFARLAKPDLSPAGVRYTERVTQVWCAFFIGNGAFACYTALYASREFWALYNGFIAYLLMGALFVGEWFCRRIFRSRMAH